MKKPKPMINWKKVWDKYALWQSKNVWNPWKDHKKKIQQLVNHQIRRGK